MKNLVLKPNEVFCSKTLLSVYVEDCELQKILNQIKGLSINDVYKCIRNLIPLSNINSLIVLISRSKAYKKIYFSNVSLKELTPSVCEEIAAVKIHQNNILEVGKH